jgi:hypothetical protein
MIERSRSMRLLPDCCPQSWLKTSDPACPIGSRDGVPSVLPRVGAIDVVRNSSSSM